MNVTAPFVLKKDVLLVPCAELSADVQRRITFAEGDFTLSHRRGRALAQVIDGDTAALLERFRDPRTIVDAIIENSRALGKDPEAYFDELLPLLGRFVENRVLVPVGAEDEREIQARYDAGASIAGWNVVRCVSLVDDTEVYQVRNGDDVAALKIARTGTPALRSHFANETEVLEALDGSGVAPRLLDRGVHEKHPYLVMEWARGVESDVAAAQSRYDRAALIVMCASIAAAYAELHARGVLHADVHPRNVLVGDGVTLVDFGYSRFAARKRRIARAGVSFYFEPEFLAARHKRVQLPASAAGEQYAVAALLYFLLAGDHYVDFNYGREEMARQIENDPPLRFAKRGIPPWPDVEAALLRALEKDPARRYGSMAELAALLAEARGRTVERSSETSLTSQAYEFLDATLQSFARGGAAFASRYPTPPTASVSFGCAGAAVGLLRIAETRGDPSLLALAEVWRTRAVALIGTPGAFEDDDTKRREILGDINPHHTESGIHATTAMLAAASGDTYAQGRAIHAFIAAMNSPCTEIDLTLGRSGCLHAAAMLLEISDRLPEAAALRAFGAETMQSIWSELDARPPIAASPAGTYFGMAHGWAGYLYAALRWCAASGDALPARLIERLHEYAAEKTPKGRGAYWRTAVDRPAQIMPSWCNGSAGQMFLFTLAHRVVGGGEWLRLAELAAWNNWEEPRNIANLCCGSAGRAYALLSLYKETGDTAWLGRARQLANHAAAHAVSTSSRANSLWKGELGVAVLVADLASPENARMPFFE